MTTATAEFLEGLGRRGHVALFEKVEGKVRLDLMEGKEINSWMVEMHRGDIRVYQGREDADCVIRTERSFFDRIVSGEAHALAALLRGLILIEGNLQLALSLGRLLPGPPHSRWRGNRRAQQGGRRR